MKLETSRKDNLSLNAEIIFGRVNPETVLSKLNKLTYILEDILNSDMYCKISQYHMPAFTEDENRMRYQELSKMANNDGADVFSVLWHLGDQVLVEKDGELLCKMPYLLYWNSITSKIGQDIVTCAWMAHRDSFAGRNRSHECAFAWKPILSTDDSALNTVLNKGLAENHYHLNGSTQSFMLNWVYLMNYPKKTDELYADSYFGKDFMSPRTVYLSNEILDTPGELIRIGAILRFELFKWACTNHDNGETTIRDDNKKNTLLSDYLLTGSIYDLNNYLEAFRNEYGIRWAKRKGQMVSLDYTISNEIYRVPEDSSFRLLTGERALLYNCFYLCYNNKMPSIIKGKFYAYLLIKSFLWREIVMANRQIGFATFERYQDRKDTLFDKDEAYSKEAYILSAVSSMAKSNVRSLEMRIVPKSKPDKLVKQVETTNKVIKDWIQEKRVRGSFFYTLHFPKGKEERDKAIDSEKNGNTSQYDPYIITKLGQVRNFETRRQTKDRALAIDKVLERNDICREYIRGIDACASELYCRPEVFATDFRFLRDRHRMTNRNNRLFASESQEKELGVTYHVGEDFMDICDGLRAVDEAIDFLNLGNGDRIGHGTVLGIDCQKYYKKKNFEITMDKQRLLDDLVWMYYKASELGVEYPSFARTEIKSKAYQLLNYIYKDASRKEQEDVPFRKYYLSMKLRGDHPELYESGKYRFKRNKDSKASERDVYLLHCSPYDYYKTSMTDPSDGIFCDNLDDFRFDENIASLYYRYHYDALAKKKGMEAEAYNIEEWYVDLIGKIQVQMRKRVAAKGITVECNPTSNYLISPIDRYDEHHIWKLDCSGLQFLDKENKCQVSVCINTDDIGVFATSLENEYALLFAAERERRKVKEKCDDCQDIYEYLDRIRENGFRVSFGEQMDCFEDILNLDQNQIRRLIKWMEKKENLLNIINDKDQSLN